MRSEWRRKARSNRDTILLHRTVVAKILGRRSRALALRSIDDGDGAPEVRHEAVQTAECPPKRARRGDTVGSPSKTGSDPVMVAPRGSGAPL
jgi:hypothetical protein